MKSLRYLSWTAVAAACGAIAATAAQAGGPPPDPGWIGLPHCTVPDVEGVPLAAAKKRLRGALCGVLQPMRRRSAAARNTVLVELPEAGTHLAPRTQVLLIVSNGKR